MSRVKTRLRALAAFYARSRAVCLRIASSDRWTDARFHELIDVNPAEIVHYQDISHWHHPRLAPYEPSRGVDARGFVRANAGKVLDGDWDLVRMPFERNNIYRLLHEHFVEGVAWEETAVFRQFAKEIAAGERRWHWSSSTEEMLEAAKGVERLYENMRQNGYRSNGGTATADAITVSIGRNGEFLYNNVGGHHRLSVAKIVGIEQVPVRVLVRHRLWQDVRDELRRSRRPGEGRPGGRRPGEWRPGEGRPGELSVRATEHLRHPDLESLLPNGRFGQGI